MSCLRPVLDIHGRYTLSSLMPRTRLGSILGHPARMHHARHAGPCERCEGIVLMFWHTHCSTPAKLGGIGDWALCASPRQLDAYHNLVADPCGVHLTHGLSCEQAHPQRKAWQAASATAAATVTVQKAQWPAKRAEAVVAALAHVKEMERPAMLAGMKEQVPLILADSVSCCHHAHVWGVWLRTSRPGGCIACWWKTVQAAAHTGILRRDLTLWAVNCGPLASASEDWLLT